MSLFDMYLGMCQVTTLQTLSASFCIEWYSPLTTLTLRGLSDAF